MKMKLLFTITAALSFVNGFFYLLAPELSLSLFGQSTNAVGILNTRFFGAAALGIGTITWLARNIQDVQFQRTIAVGVLITLSATAVAGLMGTLSGAINAVGWFQVGADTLLSLGFLLLLIRNHGSS
jgi:hypothetical protein